MTSYKDPAFQERIARAAEAKQKALDQLRAKPPVDEAVLAERQAARLAREAKDEEKREAKRQAQAEQAAKAAEAAAAGKAPEAGPAPTEAEKKAARDARYAARKRRK